MARKLLWIVLVFMVVLPGSIASGQDGKPANDPIDACTLDQVSELGDTITPFIDSYTQFNELLQKTGADGIDTLVIFADQIVVTWWEAAENLPDCAIANETKEVFGRLFDFDLDRSALHPGRE